MNQYLAIWQVECSICEASPVVGFRTPSEQVVSTGLCGVHFFGDRGMEDWEDWNNVQESTE
jgi:hypothetical protein